MIIHVWKILQGIYVQMTSAWSSETTQHLALRSSYHPSTNKRQATALPISLYDNFILV